MFCQFSEICVRKGLSVKYVFGKGFLWTLCSERGFLWNLCSERTSIEQTACQNNHLSLRGFQNPKKVSSSLKRSHLKNQTACQTWSSFFEGASKPKEKGIMIIEQIACHKWLSSLRGLQNPKKYHHHWQDLMSKMLIFLEQTACQKWSSSFMGLQNPKKVSSSLNRLHAINDHHHWEGIKTKKVSSSLSRLHAINDYHHWEGIKTQKSIIIIEQVACHKWSSSLGRYQNQKRSHPHWADCMP